MSEPDRQPGWDKRAVNRIAKEQYGGLRAMFEAHGWTTDGKKHGQVAPSRVVESYGSVAAFEKAHIDGKAANALLDPMAAIRSDPPEVWLKSFYGFDPETWGFLGFTKKSAQEKFLAESKPGALVVIAGTSDAPHAPERLRVLGMQQQTHVTGSKWEFLAPERIATERSDPSRSDRWLHAIKAVRAWRVPEEERPFVRDIFPVTHKNGDNGTAIGAYGMRLQPEEAAALLELDLVEVPVFGGNHIDVQCAVPAAQALEPSRPGPVSQSAFMVREAEGPKHLYILQLNGPADHFLGTPVGNAMIVKVGFSVSPSTRCRAHNSALPSGVFKWEVLKSTAARNGVPYPSSRHGLAGEAVMKDFLKEGGKSLGGEFFLADLCAIETAWRLAQEAARRVS